MFIKKLIIRTPEKIIREVPFYGGTNFIIDKKETRDSRNDVGKSTVLQVINFCLFSKDYKDICTDEDTKSKNIELKKFLENGIYAQLFLENGKEDICIERSFEGEKYSGGDIRIDGKEYKIKEAREQLNKIIFNNTQEPPSFRDKIAAFVRIDTNGLNNTIKYLQSKKLEEYQNLYYQFLGVDISSLTQSISNNQKLLDKNTTTSQRLFSGSSLQGTEDLLRAKQKEIYSLEKLAEAFRINEHFEQEFDELQKVKSQLDIVLQQLEMQEFKYAQIQNNLNELKKENVDISTDGITALYREANHYLPELSINLEQAIEFNNKLVQNKLRFLQSDIPELEKSIKLLKEKQQELLTEEKRLQKAYPNDRNINAYDALQRQLQLKNAEKGELTDRLDNLKDLDKEFKSLSSNIQKLENLISEKESERDRSLTEFNDIFTDLYTKVLGETNVFSFIPKKGNRKAQFEFEGTKGKVSTGKRTTVTTIFMLSLILFSQKKGFKTPRFICMDKLESTDPDDLKKIFDYINEKSENIQFISPILRKDLTEAQIKKYAVLELSKDDKFFKF